MVRQMSEQPAAERAHQEPGREQHGGIQLLRNFIAFGKERFGEVKRKRRISVEVVPFDEVADRADENGAQTPPHVGEIDVLVARPTADTCDCVMEGHR